MTIKSLWIKAALAVALALTLAACGGGSSSTTTSAVNTAPGVPPKVTASALTTNEGGQPLTLSTGNAATTWTLHGVGTLSTTTGAQITYTPPATVSANATVTIVATLNGQTTTTTITVMAPVLNLAASTVKWFVGDPVITLTATPQFITTPVTWSTQGGGSFNTTSGNNVTFTPPVVVTDTQVVISATDGGITSSLTVELAPASEKTLTLSSPTVQAGNGTVTLTPLAMISHGTLTYTASIGTVVVNGDGSAVYTPPAVLNTNTVASISATDSVSAPFTAVITVTPSATLSVTPSSASALSSGPSIPLTATVANTTTAVQWAVTSGQGSVTPSSGPTVSYVPSPTDTNANDTAIVTATLGSLTQTVTISLNFQSTARFFNPQGVAVDIAGNVYVADDANNEIRKITVAGQVTTLAGSTTLGFANGTGAAASFHGPLGVAVDSKGNVYVADSFNHAIRKITRSGVVTTLAGSGTAGHADGTGTAATFSFPAGVAVDTSGNVFVADSGNNEIREISPTGVVTTLSGNGSFGDANGAVASATFNGPNAIAIDATGNLFIADLGNSQIREISGGQVTTLAGMTNTGHADGTGAAASFRSPAGIAVDSNDNVFVADNGNSEIRMVTPAGVVTTFAGTFTGAGSQDGPGASAMFFGPVGLAIDSSGNLYVGDSNNDEIRMITSGDIVSTLAGVAIQQGSADGTAAPR